jgi:hypothetical protein
MWDLPGSIAESDIPGESDISGCWKETVRVLTCEKKGIRGYGSKQFSSGFDKAPTVCVCN